MEEINSVCSECGIAIAAVCRSHPCVRHNKGAACYSCVAGVQHHIVDCSARFAITIPVMPEVHCFVSLRSGRRRRRRGLLGCWQSRRSRLFKRVGIGDRHCTIGADCSIPTFARHAFADRRTLDIPKGVCCTSAILLVVELVRSGLDLVQATTWTDVTACAHAHWSQGRGPCHAVVSGGALVQLVLNQLRLTRDCNLTPRRVMAFFRRRNWIWQKTRFPVLVEQALFGFSVQ